MLKSCSICGGIHKRGETCPNFKPIDYVKKDELYEFRNSAKWQKKREEIKLRDKHLCIACLNRLPGTIKQYNSVDLQVHHIQPLKTNWEQRLDDDNLITLCKTHHKMAEIGVISAEKLKKMINEL